MSVTPCGEADMNHHPPKFDPDEFAKELAASYDAEMEPPTEPDEIGMTLRALHHDLGQTRKDMFRLHEAVVATQQELRDKQDRLAGGLESIDGTLKVIVQTQQDMRLQLEGQEKDIRQLEERARTDIRQLEERAMAEMRHLHDRAMAEMRHLHDRATQEIASKHELAMLKVESNKFELKAEMLGLNLSTQRWLLATTVTIVATVLTAAIGLGQLILRQAAN
jgi:TolA-binding protein